MLFNSLDFAVFLPAVFILYWILNGKNVNFQNSLIVIASYIFYGWWDWRFLLLIVFSTVVDYTLGLWIHKSDDRNKRRYFLYASLLINLGLLGFFKYYNFFVENFVDAFTFFGNPISTSSLNIILPVGISFYTFQTLSYTIDVYRKKLEPTSNFISFAAFVSFFPQLVAGPIERATNLLPQFYTKRNFNLEQAKIGVRQIVWGLFKKVVIADTCAQYANQIFDNSANHDGFTLLMGAVAFTFQIYGDFSGYSDIAIGTARLFNFRLMENFRYPYFSRDIAEFWRRWHISLSTWFRDYLYIPLGGSRVSRTKVIRNVFIIFVVSGFWHGANWTYIFWGFLNALYFLPSLLRNKNRNYLDTVAENRLFPSFKEVFLILKTFALSVIAWIFFRSPNMEFAFSYITNIFSKSWELKRLAIERYSVEFLPLILILIIIEWMYRNESFPLLNDNKFQLKTVAVIVLILMFGSFSDLNNFIYFQF